MVFLWVYVCVFPLGICYSYILPFGFILYICSSSFGDKVRLDGQGEVWFPQRARQELWWENPFLTTTATQLCRELSNGRCIEIQRWWKRTGRQQVYGDTWVAEMNGVSESIYLGDPRVGNLYRILYLISYYLILQQIPHSIIPIF